MEEQSYHERHALIGSLSLVTRKCHPHIYETAGSVSLPCYLPQYNSTFPNRTLSPTLTPASSRAFVTPIYESVTCNRSIPSSLSNLDIFTARSTRFPFTI